MFAVFGIEGSEIFVAAEEGRSAFWELGNPDPIRQNELVREEFVAISRDHEGQTSRFRREESCRKRARW